jgi:hypothetical protein
MEGRDRCGAASDQVLDLLRIDFAALAAVAAVDMQDKPPPDVTLRGAHAGYASRREEVDHIHVPPDTPDPPRPTVPHR